MSRRNILLMVLVGLLAYSFIAKDRVDPVPSRDVEKSTTSRLSMPPGGYEVVAVMYSCTESTSYLSDQFITAMSLARSTDEVSGVGTKFLEKSPKLIITSLPGGYDDRFVFRIDLQGNTDSSGLTAVIGSIRDTSESSLGYYPSEVTDTLMEVVTSLMNPLVSNICTDGKFILQNVRGERA